ncbi:MAG: DUF1911 domain-containing protein [Hymenobacter sp.]|nr:MAG: DUF1911 domain-containing protein [Hymenobacter sp.]
MIKREPLRSEEYFDEFIALKRQAVIKDSLALTTYPEQFARPDAAAVFLLNDQRALLVAEYSRGYALDLLYQEYLTVLESLERLVAIDIDGTFTLIFKNDIDSYVEALWLLSQAYLLGLEHSAIERLLDCLGPAGQDLLFERLVAAVLPGSVRKPAKKLLYPKAYQALYEALDAPAAQQAELLQQFLSNWYKQMRNTGWHDAHKMPNGGGYFGYWCWEAAAVAVALGVDDTGFRDSVYYPRDLADFARARLSS